MAAREAAITITTHAPDRTRTSKIGRTNGVSGTLARNANQTASDVASAISPPTSAPAAPRAIYSLRTNSRTWSTRAPTSRNDVNSRLRERKVIAVVFAMASRV
jgi:hypothetical protein